MRPHNNAAEWEVCLCSDLQRKTRQWKKRIGSERMDQEDAEESRYYFNTDNVKLSRLYCGSATTTWLQTILLWLFYTDRFMMCKMGVQKATMDDNRGPVCDSTAYLAPIYIVVVHWGGNWSASDLKLFVLWRELGITAM